MRFPNVFENIFFPGLQPTMEDRSPASQTARPVRSPCSWVVQIDFPTTSSSGVSQDGCIKKGSRCSLVILNDVLNHSEFGKIGVEDFHSVFTVLLSDVVNGFLQGWNWDLFQGTTFPMDVLV